LDEKVLRSRSKSNFLERFEVAVKLKITQIKSAIGYTKKQKQMVRALGIKKLYQSVEQKDTPQIRGMIEKVKHLLKVEEV